MADKEAKRVAKVRKLAALESNKPCMNCGKDVRGRPASRRRFGVLTYWIRDWQGPQGTVCVTFNTFVCSDCAGLQ
jgi:hypothetical protein